MYRDIYKLPILLLPDNVEIDYHQFNWLRGYAAFASLLAGLLFKQIYSSVMLDKVDTLIDSYDLRFDRSCCPWALRFRGRCSRGTTLALESIGNVDLLGICNRKGFVVITTHCIIETIFVLIEANVRIYVLDEFLQYRIASCLGMARIFALHVPELLDWLIDFTGLMTCIGAKTTVEQFLRWLLRRPIFSKWRKLNMNQKDDSIQINSKQLALCTAASGFSTIVYLLWNAVQIAIEGLLQGYNVRGRVNDAVYIYRIVRVGGLIGSIPIFIGSLLALVIGFIKIGYIARGRIIVGSLNRISGTNFFGCGLGMKLELTVRAGLLVCVIHPILKGVPVRDYILVYDACPPLAYIDFIKVMINIVFTADSLFLLIWTFGTGGSWLGHYELFGCGKHPIEGRLTLGTYGWARGFPAEFSRYPTLPTTVDTCNTRGSQLGSLVIRSIHLEEGPEQPTTVSLNKN